MSFGKAHGSFFCIFIQKSGGECGSPQKSFGAILGSVFPTVVSSLGQRTRKPTNNAFLTQLPLPWILFSQCSRAEGFIFSPRQWWDLVRGSWVTGACPTRDAKFHFFHSLCFSAPWDERIYFSTLDKGVCGFVLPGGAALLTIKAVGPQTRTDPKRSLFFSF